MTEEYKPPAFNLHEIGKAALSEVKSGPGLHTAVLGIFDAAKGLAERGQDARHQQGQFYEAARDNPIAHRNRTFYLSSESDPQANTRPWKVDAPLIGKFLLGTAGEPLEVSGATFIWEQNMPDDKPGDMNALVLLDSPGKRTTCKIDPQGALVRVEHADVDGEGRTMPGGERFESPEYLAAVQVNFSSFLSQVRGNIDLTVQHRPSH